MRLCLTEDEAVAGLDPLTLTRPVFDLMLGGGTLGSKIARAFGVGPGPSRRGVVVRPYLEASQRERDPKSTVNDRDWLAKGPVVVANGRWVPPEGFRAPEDGDAPWIGLCDGRPAFAVVGPDRASALEPLGVDDWFEDALEHLDAEEVGGEWINRPWDIVAKNAEHVARDFARDGRVGVSNRHLATAAIVGPVERLYVHETARIDPYTVFDTTNGPITIGPSVWVQPFTRIEGPSYIGRDSQLFRANLRGGVTIGPNCRIGGEVEASIIHGRSNKYHEGFLGHAYVGEWVNLGGITSNSDLRNDYGEVQVPIGGVPVATGMTKVGCFIGDHTRTGLGSMLNTGTTIGVMCNVLPAGPLLPKHVPSFSALIYGKVAPGFPIGQLFATAKIVMSRRDQVFTETEEQLYLDIYEQTQPERERAYLREQRKNSVHWPLSAVQ